MDAAILSLIANIASTTPCACGCQEVANPEVPYIRLLRQAGLTFRAISRYLGCDRSYPSKLMRSPPRYVKGHSSQTLVWRRVRCQECERPFMQLGAGQTHCQYSWCQQVKWLQVQNPNELPLLREKRRAQERRVRQERLVHEDQMRERRNDRGDIGYGAISIYKPIQNGGGEDLTLLGSLSDPLADPADVLAEKERADEFRRVLGGIHDAEDWRKLNSETQSWYRAKLMRSGLLSPNAA